MSKGFFQESIDEAIWLLVTGKKVAAFDLIEKMSGMLAGIKGKEEQEFAQLMRYANEFLRYLHEYEIARDKAAVAKKMELLTKAIAGQAQKVVSLSSPKGLERSSLKHFLGRILASVRLLKWENTSEKKLLKRKYASEEVKAIVLEHSLLRWKEKEAQEFSLMINYIDDYLRCLYDAKVAIRKDTAAAIKHLRKAKIFGVLIVKQAERLAALL